MTLLPVVLRQEVAENGTILLVDAVHLLTDRLDRVHALLVVALLELISDEAAVDAFELRLVRAGDRARIILVIRRADRIDDPIKGRLINGTTKIFPAVPCTSASSHFCSHVCGRFREM